MADLLAVDLLMGVSGLVVRAADLELGGRKLDLSIAKGQPLVAELASELPRETH